MSSNQPNKHISKAQMIEGIEKESRQSKVKKENNNN